MNLATRTAAIALAWWATAGATFHKVTPFTVTVAIVAGLALHRIARAAYQVFDDVLGENR